MRSRPLVRAAVVLLALLLALFAQFLFDNPGISLHFAGRELLPGDAPSVLAAVMLVLAAVLFAVAAPAPTYAPFYPSDHPPTSTASRNLPHQPLVWISLTSYLLTLIVFLTQGEGPLLYALWLASMVMLVLSQWRHGVSGRRRFFSSPDPDQPRWLVYGPPLMILILAGALRLFRLTDLPQDIHGDMASHGLQAQAILRGQVSGLIGVGWADIPLTGFLPTVATMALTGDQGLLGLRLASAIGGVLSIGGLYLLLVQLASRRIALLASALLAIAYTHIHFSRIAQYMDPVPFTIWSLVLLVWGLRSANGLAFVLSGVLMAAACLLYYSGRAAPVIVALFLFYLMSTDRPTLWARREGLLLLGAAFLITLGPLLPYFLTYMQPLWARTQAVFWADPEVLAHLSAKYGVAGPGPILAEQTRRSLLMFNAVRDSSTQFGLSRPMVDSITGPLVVLGTAYALRYLKQPGNALLLLFLAALLLGSILTNNAPFWPRLVAILLPASGLAAVAADRSWQSIGDALGLATCRWIAVGMIAGLIAMGMNNWLIYQEAVALNGRPRALVGRFVATLPAETVICLVPENRRPPFDGIHSLEEREIALFLDLRLGLEVPVQNPFELDTTDRLCRQSGAVWIIPQSGRSVLQPLTNAHPGGHLEQHGSRPGEPVFLSYELP